MIIILLTLIQTLNWCECGIISAYHSLNGEIQTNLNNLVAKGDFDLFKFVLDDYTLDSSNSVYRYLWSYICTLYSSESNSCNAISPSTTSNTNGQIAFAELQSFIVQTFTGNWMDITFESYSIKKGIEIDSNSGVTFEFSGIYKFTVGHTGGDDGTQAWHGCRIYGDDSGTVGVSNYANVARAFNNAIDLSQHSFSFFGEINNTSDVYHIQKGTYNGGSIIIPLQTTFDGGWDSGDTLPSIIALIEYVGQL
eukprot:217221_1